MEFELTKDEEKAIRALKRLEKIWPDTLWIFSASGTLHIMRAGENGEQIHEKQFGGIDPDYSIYASSKIHNDGGDW